MALLFAPSINTTINKLRFLSTSNNSGAQIQFGLFSYDGNWSDAANTIPVQIVGEHVTHTITKGMNIVALVVEGMLKSNYTLSQLIDLRNVNGDATRQQLENPNYPQGCRTVPWFMLS